MRQILFSTIATIITLASLIQAAEFASHPPTRPLPAASQRPLDKGPHYFVDPVRGDDTHEGSEARPWRNIQHGVKQLKPGDTLVLRGGTYNERVAIDNVGTIAKPITVRAFPGELVVAGGGFPEFFDSPQTAWEPCLDGVPGEYRSTKTYPGLSDDPIRTNLLGNFGDSWLPLHGYRFRTDLQSDNPYWNVPEKTDGDGHVYCGPGLWYDTQTGRIHVRLAHTRLPGLHEMNYRGETDPCKLPLVVAAGVDQPTISLKGARNVRLQDLVLRGARGATLAIHDSTNIELDGLTVYGGSTCVQVRDTHGLLVTHSACRGLAAPWTFRGSLKYRAIESRLFSASGWDPTGNDNTDFEIAYSEFTDSVDGVFIGQVRGVRFHHNLVENVSDDAMFLTAATGFDGLTHGGDVRIYQNRFARNLTCFAFGVGHGRQKVLANGKQTGLGAWIYRNVFDFRRPVMYHWPTGPDDEQELTSTGRVGGDHGSPTWEPMWIYHNTILSAVAPRYAYGTDGIAHGLGTNGVRRVFNNIFCQKLGIPGETLPAATADFQGDGNLFWSAELGDQPRDRFLGKFRASLDFDKSKKSYPGGWTAHDRYADPGFVRYEPDWRKPVDLRLGDNSPAVDAGVKLDASWPDGVRDWDAGLPDLGAVPRGVEPWRVGIAGRLDPFGNESAAAIKPVLAVTPQYAKIADESQPVRRPRALIVQGYPAFDAPMVAYALRKAGAEVELTEKTWVDPQRFQEFAVVVYDASLARAKVEPNRFSDDDLPVVQKYLTGGGTLVLLRERFDLFASPAGQQFLSSIVGSNSVRKPGEATLLAAGHPWLKHLGGRSPDWLPLKNASVLRVAQGESIIGSRDGATILYQVPIGHGRLIYMGWSPAAALPQGRKPGTVEDERRFEEQMGVYMNLAKDVAAR